jgi:hypothetical protein
LNDERLKVVDVVEHVLNGATYFAGTVENHGSQTARSVEVEVDLFSGGKFVDQYTSYHSGSLPSASSRYFKVACGCKNSPPASHDSFKVEVHNGFDRLRPDASSAVWALSGSRPITDELPTPPICGLEGRPFRDLPERAAPPTP